MGSFFARHRTLVALGFFAAVGCMPSAPALAGVQDSVFFINSDGSNVSFDVRDVSRREVLDRLLITKEIKLEWVDSAFGDEKISGAYKGTADAVLRRLLAQSDFVLVYDHDGDRSRIARLIIVGKASSSASKKALPEFAELKAKTPAALPQQVDPPAKAVAPADDQTAAFRAFSAPIDFTPPSAADRATPLFTPPPAGAVPPMLIPPSPSEAGPLFKPADSQMRLPDPTK